MMEDPIIVAVCGKPKLYDSTNYFYRDKYRKDRAWRRISEETGVADRWTGVQQRGYSAVVGVPEADHLPKRDSRSSNWVLDRRKYR
ncbi:hypothetical protein ILYODFUR_038917 [Ilyodon furcidens]|uniref:MADF domain-containing protein n=1 Tax=Ilyodon furcidens TaxID=33524 RepID=A0ABV0UMM8_9TELE